MRRRALLTSIGAALLTGTAGCLGTTRRQLSGPIRFGHARARVHDARDGFVAGGLGGSDAAPETAPYAAWLFPSPPADDVSVFTDALGAENRRQWDNEVHNENYEEGFVLLAQVRTPRERATTLRPGPVGCDAAWTGWRRARVPVGLVSAEMDADELPDAETVVATALVYLEANDAPREATVPFLSPQAASCTAANETLTARPWAPPN